MTRRMTPGSQQIGFTLVELLVAMAVSTLVALAAMSSLLVSRQGYASVDAASQLRDGARFAVDRIQRVAVQAGFKDIGFAATARPSNAVGIAANPAPAVSGFNNSLVGTPDPSVEGATRSAGTVGYGSDVLLIRVQIPETFPGSGTADASMIDCAGNPAANVTADRDTAVTNVIHVAEYRGEPALMCSTVSATGTVSPARPIVQGVENFQVLYGVDGAVANVAPTGIADSIADRFLRADELVVPGDSAGTNANWRRVRSIRIGMILRGHARSAIDGTPLPLYPFGPSPGSSGGAAGAALSSANDPGTSFDPPADGRLRQIVTFTVHLRNDQGL